MIDPTAIKGLKDVRELLTRHATGRYNARAVSDITHLTVHHSLTKSGSAEAFARYHVNTLGWPGIGYHFVIEKDGKIKWCNPVEHKTYHVGSSNKFTVGVCMTGDFRSEDPTAAQEKSLDTLLRWLMRELSIPVENVQGHSEFPGYSSKACPCIDMVELRSGLKQKKKNISSLKRGRLSNTKAKRVYRLPQQFSHFNHLTGRNIRTLNPQVVRDWSHERPTLQVRPGRAKALTSKKSTEISRYIRKMKDAGYTVFTSDKKDYNLNILGLRSANTVPNSFDDEIVVFWKYQGSWTLKKYKATTDPGLYWLENPENTSGTAILKPGQYRGAYILGKHRGDYKALVQQGGPVTVIRDFDRDNRLDFHSGKEQTGFFGINIHRSSAHGTSTQVDRWSAGCQVFANVHDFNEFMNICTKASLEWGNRFSYSLLQD